MILGAENLLIDIECHYCYLFLLNSGTTYSLFPCFACQGSSSRCLTSNHPTASEGYSLLLEHQRESSRCEFCLLSRTGHRRKMKSVGVSRSSEGVNHPFPPLRSCPCRQGPGPLVFRLSPPTPPVERGPERPSHSVTLLAPVS